MRRRTLSVDEMRVLADAIAAAVDVIAKSKLPAEGQLRVARALDGDLR